MVNIKDYIVSDKEDKSNYSLYLTKKNVELIKSKISVPISQLVDDLLKEFVETQIADSTQSEESK